MAISIRSETTGGTTTAHVGGGFSVTKPSSVENGDVLVAIVGRQGGVFGDPEYPAGWVKGDSNYNTAGNDRFGGIYYKIITNAAGEPASYDFTSAGIDEPVGWWVGSLSGVSTGTVQDVAFTGAGAWAALANDTSPNAPAVTSVTAGAMAFACWVVNSDAAITMPGGSWATRAANVGGNGVLSVASQTLGVSGTSTGSPEITNVATGQESEVGMFLFRMAAYTYESSISLGKRNSIALNASYSGISVDFELGSVTGTNGFSSVTNSADLSATVGAALAGTSYGMQVTVDDNTARYGIYTLPSVDTNGIVRCRFYIDPNTLGNSGNDSANIVQFSTSSGIGFGYIRLNYQLGSYKIQIVHVVDTPANVEGTSINITDAPHCIEAQITKASTIDANDGTFNLWIDDVLVDTITGVDAFTRWGTGFGQLRVGFTYSVNTFNGNYFIDEIKFNTTGVKIGLKAQTYNDALTLGKLGGLTLSSLFAYNNSISLGKRITLSSLAIGDLLSSLSLNKRNELGLNSTASFLAGVQLNLGKSLSSVSESSTNYTVDDIILEWAKLSGDTYEDALTLSKRAELFSSAILNLSALLPLPKRNGITSSVSQTMESSISLATARGMTMASVIDLSVAISFSHALGITDLSNLTLATVLQLSQAKGILVTSQATLDQYLTLVRSDGITVFSVADYYTAITLLRSLGITSLVTTGINEQITLGSYRSLLTNGGASFVGLLTLSMGRSLTDSATLSANALLTLERQELILTEAISTLFAGVSLAKAQSVVSSVLGNYYQQISLARTLGIQIGSAANEYESSLVLSVGKAINTQSLADLQASLTLALLRGIEPSVLASINANLLLSKAVSLTLSNISSLESSLSLQKRITLTTLSDTSLEDTLSLGRVLTISFSPTHTVEERISLSRGDSIATNANAIFALALSLSRQMALSASGGITVEEAIALLYQEAITFSSEVGTQTFFETLVLAKELAISTASLAAFETSTTFAKQVGISFESIATLLSTLSLGRTLSLSTTAGMLISGVIELLRKESETANATVTLNENIGLGVGVGLSEQSLADLLAQLSLGKVVGLSSTTTMEMVDDISLGRVLEITLAGGLQYDEDIAISIHQGLSLAAQVLAALANFPAKLVISDKVIWLLSVNDSISPQNVIIETDDTQADLSVKDMTDV